MSFPPAEDRHKKGPAVAHPALFYPDDLLATAWINPTRTPAGVHKVAVTSARIDEATIGSAHFTLLTFLLFLCFLNFLFHFIPSFLPEPSFDLKAPGNPGFSRKNTF